MELFFDILLYISFFVSIPLFIIGVERFPKWIAKIDPAKCKSGKRVDRYLENQFCLQYCKILLMVLPCAAVSVVSLLNGSMPNELEEVGLLLGVPVLLDFVFSFIGGMFLGEYFLATAYKYGIYQKPTDYMTARTRVMGTNGMGVFVCFYLSLIMMFAMIHLFYTLGVI